MSITKPVKIDGNMEFPYVTDTGLVWPNGKNKRKSIDHIQIHHTVGNYGTAAKWAALHKRKIADGQKGVPYGYLVTQDGQIFLGRGLEFSHGGVKDSLTTNEQGIGANQRSVAIALDGDMREAHLPTAKQLAAAVRLVQGILAHYGDVKVLGHNEVPTYSNKKPTGKTYATLCPCLDMKAFRDLVKGAALPVPEPEPEIIPDADPNFPAVYKYAGSTFSNVRQGPGTKFEIVDKVKAGELVEVLDAQADDTYMWYRLRRLYPANPPKPGHAGYTLDGKYTVSGAIGWCTANYLKEA